MLTFALSLHGFRLVMRPPYELRVKSVTISGVTALMGEARPMSVGGTAVRKAVSPLTLRLCRWEPTGVCGSSQKRVLKVLVPERARQGVQQCESVRAQKPGSTRGGRAGVPGLAVGPPCPSG